MSDVSVNSYSFLAPIWSTGGRRLALLVCVVVAVSVTTVTALGSAYGDGPQTFAESAHVVQSAVSVPLPFLGVLLAGDVRTVAVDPRSGRRQRGHLWWARVASSAIAAVVVAALGLVAVGAATAVVGGAWAAAPRIAVASVVVQLVAQLIGFAVGLLLRPAWLAMLLDACVPVGLWAVAGLLGFAGAQAWLFPYDSVGDLLSVQTSALDWAQEAVVVAVWIVVPTALAWARVGRVRSRDAGRGGRVRVRLGKNRLRADGRRSDD